MGKSPKPLNILAHPSLREALAPLEVKGHTIHYMDWADVRPLAYDIILGPTCRKMNENLVKYIEIAVHEAWTVKYGDKKAGQRKPKPVGEGGLADGHVRPAGDAPVQEVLPGYGPALRGTEAPED